VTLDDVFVQTIDLIFSTFSDDFVQTTDLTLTAATTPIDATMIVSIVACMASNEKEPKQNE
jgi:hypothetical protein